MRVKAFFMTPKEMNITIAIQQTIKITFWQPPH